MVSKALMWFGMLVLAIAGSYAYKHYRHAWGYDDDTQIHPVNISPSLPSSRLDPPIVGRPAAAVVRVAA